MPNTAVRNIGRFVVCVHNDKAPTEQEWQSYLTVTRAAARSVGGDYARIRTLVFTDGGGPNAVQRAAVNELIGSKPSPGAIITQSTMVRGIVTALSWFNPAIKAFHPRDIMQGFKHLQMSTEEIAEVWPVLRKLQSEVAGIQVLSNVAQV